MSYPGTIFEYVDQSDIPVLETSKPIVPTYMVALTADKGPEEDLFVEGKDFFSLYGNSISFERHGQPLLQAAGIINAGGRLYVKRVVASDAKLANTTIVAKVQDITAQKVDSQNKPLYKDKVTGKETTSDKPSSGEGTNEPIMVHTASITYESVSTTEATSITAIKETSTALLDDKGKQITKLEKTYTEFTYPLFVISDNGRGISAKKFKIVPDYSTSKNLDFMLYRLQIIENNELLSDSLFSMNPDTVYLNINRSMERAVNTKYSQVKTRFINTGFEKMMEKIKTISGEDVTNLDFIFGKNRDGSALNSISISSDGLNIGHVYGVGLSNGSNGKFGTTPKDSETYGEELAKFYNGTFTPRIYDYDNTKIDVIVDANYPESVKLAIEDFVTFREDCIYLGDLGTNISSIEEAAALYQPRKKNKFCSFYSTSYDIIDPYSKKQIKVTICYNLAILLVDHFANGRTRPLAGYLYNMVIPEAIEGTINFIPILTPSVNQKETMDDLRINYASLYDGLLTIETEYNSQDKHSQFSYINNILAIQEVIHAIRERCPKIRYRFIDGDDLEKYKEDVQAIINRYSGNFKSITLEYIGDPNYVANKIFYAAIKVQFRDFAQSEYFKIYALS